MWPLAMKKIQIPIFGSVWIGLSEYTCTPGLSTQIAEKNKTNFGSNKLYEWVAKSRISRHFLLYALFKGDR